MTKMTYTLAIETVVEALAGTDIVDVEVLDKLDALKASLAKRNKGGKAKGLTKTQKENIGLKEAIVACLDADGKYTITEIMTTVPQLEGLTNQKVSALVRQLVKEDLMERTEEKGKAYFNLV